MDQYLRRKFLLQIKLTLFFVFVINCKVGFSQIVSALPPGFNFVVYDLAFDSSSQSLYACGNFTSLANGIPGTPMNFISKWNGSTWDSLGSGADHYVFRVAIYNSQLIATGYFENIGGIAASGLARWDGNNWHFMGNPSRNGVLCPIKSLYVDEWDPLESTCRHASLSIL